jgi:uncharacterized protein (TIGR03086 family)
VEYPLNQAMQSTLAVLTSVRPGDLGAPTPCASRDVRALVNHFVGTARWWAATIDGEGGGADADYAAGDYVAAYEESIRIAVGAFAAEGALERTVRLPFGEFPGTVLLGQAAMEQFTHGWERLALLQRVRGAVIGAHLAVSDRHQCLPDRAG